MKNLKKTMMLFAIVLCGFSNSQAQTQRISMNVTVGRQTIAINAIEGGCVISAPLQKAYFVNTTNNTISEISQGELSNKLTKPKQTQGATFGEKVNAGLHQAGGALASGASALGGAMPGGSIISAAVSSVSSMSIGGGASSAAYAATGRMASWSLNSMDTHLNLPENLPDGDYALTFVIAEQGNPSKKQVHFGFSIENNVLKTKHDTVKNSINNVR